MCHIFQYSYCGTVLCAENTGIRYCISDCSIYGAQLSICDLGTQDIRHLYVFKKYSWENELLRKHIFEKTYQCRDIPLPESFPSHFCHIITQKYKTRFRVGGVRKRQGTSAENVTSGKMFESEKVTFSPSSSVRRTVCHVLGEAPTQKWSCQTPNQKLRGLFDGAHLIAIYFVQYYSSIIRLYTIISNIK